MNKNITLTKTLDGYAITILQKKTSTKTIARTWYISEDEFEGVYKVLFEEHFKREDKKMKEMKNL